MVPPDHHDPLEEHYDPDVLARIDGRGCDDVLAGDDPVAVSRRGASGVVMAGALLSGAVRGLADLLEPRADEAVVELRPEHPDDGLEPVTVHLVPSDPRATVIVVRPWLAWRLRR